MNSVTVNRDAGADRTTFVGAVISPAIKKLPKMLEAVGTGPFQELLACALDDLAGEAVDHARFAGLAVGELTEEVIASTFAGLHELLRASFRLPHGSCKKRTYSDDLEFLKFSPEYAMAITKAVYSDRRTAIEAASEENRVRLPGLSNFKWRVDVAISTSLLKRALKPAVLMQMTLSNGKIHTFEMPVEQFHKLRYNVAFVLKEIEDLEKRSVLQKGA